MLQASHSLAVSALLVLALALTGCGDDQPKGTPTAPGGLPAEHPDEAATEHDHDHEHDGDHDHDHDHDGHHHGVKAALADAAGATAAHAELKLHDDLGDLELWLTKDEAGKWPLDLPLDTTIEVAIGKAPDAKTVTMRVRDTETNPDESGKSTIRNGKTNYFIFPGDTGEDAAWLTGAEFSAPAVIKVPHEDGTLTATLTLVPHKH